MQTRGLGPILWTCIGFSEKAIRPPVKGRWQHFGFYPDRLDFGAVCPTVEAPGDGLGGDLEGNREQQVARNKSFECADMQIWGLRAFRDVSGPEERAEVARPGSGTGY